MSQCPAQRSEGQISLITAPSSPLLLQGALLPLRTLSLGSRCLLGSFRSLAAFCPREHHSPAEEPRGRGCPGHRRAEAPLHLPSEPPACPQRAPGAAPSPAGPGGDGDKAFFIRSSPAGARSPEPGSSTDTSPPATESARHTLTQG